MNLGKRLVADLKKEFPGSNPKCSQKRSQGFTWWPYNFAQTVEVVGEEKGPDGMHGFLIALRTDAAKLDHLDDRSLLYVNRTARALTSLAGPVYDRDRGILQLASLLRVHDEIAPMARKLASAACLLQMWEVQIWATLGQILLGAVPAHSSPPGKPEALHSDQFLTAVRYLMRAEGHGHSSGTEWEFAMARQLHQDFCKAYPATHSGLEFTWQQPWLERTCLGQLQGHYCHPLYGTGLLLRQSFPVRVPSPAAGARLTMLLNAKEFTRGGLGYGLGSWTFHAYMLQFTAFVPRSYYRPELVPNLYVAAFVRAHMLREEGLPQVQ